jgi:hypothetical protein
MRRGAIIRTVINRFTFDGATKDPMATNRAIAFMAATAQAQAEATKAAQRAGIEHAKQRDKRVYLGPAAKGLLLAWIISAMRSLSCVPRFLALNALPIRTRSVAV